MAFFLGWYKQTPKIMGWWLGSSIAGWKIPAQKGGLNRTLIYTWEVSHCHVWWHLMTQVVRYPHFHILYPQYPPVVSKKFPISIHIPPTIVGHHTIPHPAALHGWLGFRPRLCGAEWVCPCRGWGLDSGCGRCSWEPMEFGSWGSRKWQLNGNMMLETMEFALTLVVDEPIWSSFANCLFVFSY